MKIAKKRKIIVDELVVKKLPEDLNGKNSKKITRKKGNVNNLIRSSYFKK